MRSRVLVRAAIVSGTALLCMACSYDFTVGDGSVPDGSTPSDGAVPEDGAVDSMSDGTIPGIDGGRGGDAAPDSSSVQPIICVSGDCHCTTNMQCEIGCSFMTENCTLHCDDHSTCDAFFMNSGTSTLDCDPNSSCGFTCTNGNCTINCNSATCMGSCGGGDCTMNCGAGSTCSFTNCGAAEGCRCLGAGCP